MIKTQILINQPVYLDLSILHMSKTVMSEFWYDYIKPKFGKNEKLCYMDTESFIIHLRTEDSYKQKMLKKDLKLQILNWTDHCLKEKIRKSNWINER